MKINCEYRSAHLDSGWRQSWTTILSGRFSDSTRDTIFLYDRSGETAEFYSIDGVGNITLLNIIAGLRSSWDQIVPGSFGGGPFTGLLFYDRNAGEGDFCSTDGQGNLTLLAAYTGWRKTWQCIRALEFNRTYTGLLFYDRASGEGEFYATDGRGGLTLQQSHSNWRKTWRDIIPLRIENETFLLFYEGSSGIAELYAVDIAGQLELRRTYDGWRGSWSIIRAVSLQSSTYIGLFFYDPAAGEAELYTIDQSGVLNLVKRHTDWRKSWSLMTNGRFGGVYDDLLFYDQEAGEGEFFALDPWPLKPLEGYVASESVVPGEPNTLHVRSTVGPFRARLVRRGLSDSSITSIGIFADVPVNLPLDSPENGCNWPAAATFSVPPGSPSGLYIILLSSLDGGVTAEVAFVVRSDAPGVATRILFAMPTSTYEAYSWWGGRSLYGHGLLGGGFSWAPPSAFRVSPRRPYLSPDDFVKPKFQYWEMPFIRWLERNGIVVDYCSSFDVHTQPDLLANYNLIVTAGHDEYWSWEMRDNVEQFVAAGGTMAVLSGNSVWWQIRFEEGAGFTCYKSLEDDPVKSKRATVNWTEPVVTRPETLMTGVSFKYGAYFNYEGSASTEPPFFTVVSQHSILENTGIAIIEK